MKITIESTPKVITFDGLPARIWEGETAGGVPIHAYITRVAVPEGLPSHVYTEFETELKQERKASAAIEAIPLRMIL